MIARSLAVGVTAMAIAIAATATRVHTSDYDRHVVFDNSVAPNAYYWGSGAMTAPSSLALTGGKIPVDTAPCVSPPNCLRLAWQSRRGGDWRVTLGLRKHWGGLDYAGDSLSFWVYAEQELTRRGLAAGLRHGSTRRRQPHDPPPWRSAVAPAWNVDAHSPPLPIVCRPLRVDA